MADLPTVTWTLVLGALLLAALAYATGWVRLARRAPRLPSTSRLVAAMSALAVVATALLSPLDGLAHERFVAHMAQHLLLTSVAVPLALLADPFPVVVWALPARARAALRPLLARGGALRRPLAALTSMPVAWVAFLVTLWAWHLPALYERALADASVHALEHATFAGAALLFWWPVLGPAPRLRRRPSPIAAIVYVVLGAFQSAALGLALMLWPAVLYPSHPGGREDQALGGILMWSVSGIVDMAVVMTLVWRFLAGAESATGARFLDRSHLVREN